jgi:hypothetical protein
MSKLARRCRRQNRTPLCLVQPSNASLPSRKIGARSQIPADKSATLTGVQKYDRLLCLDAVGKPVLQPDLIDGKLRERSWIGPTIVVLRDQIKSAAFRDTVRGSEQNERIPALDRRARTPPNSECPSRVSSSWPVAASHRLKWVLPEPPESRRAPSGENVTDVASSECPSKVRSSWPVAASQVGAFVEPTRSPRDRHAH